MCNGYYGPNFGEPICGTCHSFLFPLNEPEQAITKLSDDEDSGNDEPPYNIADRERIEREDLAIVDENDNTPEEPEELFFPIPRPDPPRNLNQYVDLLSQAQAVDRNEGRIDSLPVEVLLTIFSHLDDISLWNVSEVCKQWKNILETHTSQNMWKKYTKERWPLLQQMIALPNWFKVSYKNFGFQNKNLKDFFPVLLFDNVLMFLSNMSDSNGIENSS